MTARAARGAPRGPSPPEPSVSSSPLLSCSAEPHCITCSDEALPLRVLEAPGGDGLAVCADPAGRQTSVATDLVGPVAPGDTLLVHAGVALTRLPERFETGERGAV